MRKLKTATKNGDRLEQLRILSVLLAEQIEADKADGGKNMPQLSKQYRETIKEIEDIEGASAEDDEIWELLSKREADGKSGAVRKGRSAV